MSGDYFTMGKEAVAYDTAAATLTRGFEIQGDDFELIRKELESRGMRAGTVSKPTNSVVSRITGANGTVPLDLRSKGMGIFFEGASGSYAITTPVGATDARLHTGTPTIAGPTTSYTQKWHRFDMGGTDRVFQYGGAMVEQLVFAQEPEQYTKMTASMIAKSFKDSTADAITASTPSYPGGTLFDWQTCTISVDGNDLCTRTFTLTLPTGLEQRYLTGCTPKPRVKGRIEPTGTFTVDFNDMDLYRNYVDGDDIPIVITWTGEIIEDTTPESLTITIPAAKLTGSTPHVSLDDYPTLVVPFDMTSNGTDAPWTIEYVTTDTAV